MARVSALGDPHHDGFLFPQEIFGDTDVGIGQSVVGRRRGMLPQARFLQIFAGLRDNRSYSRVRCRSRRGRYRAPIPGQCRRARFFSHSLQGAFTGRITLSYHRCMLRTDVYLKVEVVLDEKESAERVAAEICRQIRKIAWRCARRKYRTWWTGTDELEVPSACAIISMDLENGRTNI